MAHTGNPTNTMIVSIQIISSLTPFASTIVPLHSSPFGWLAVLVWNGEAGTTPLTRHRRWPLLKKTIHSFSSPHSEAKFSFVLHPAFCKFFVVILAPFTGTHPRVYRGTVFSLFGPDED